MLTRRLLVLIGAVMVLTPALAVADIASVDFASNANNLNSGTVSVSRLPVGSSSSTVAAGNDVRFNSIAYGRPTETVDSTRVLVWVE